jgi:invasion protein IalB
MRRLAFALLAGLFAPAAAMAAGLPGGASSLDETHGDWIVHCEMQSADAVSCVMRQQQVEKSSGQRVLAIELRPSGGALVGTLVMPFGLALDAGVALNVDDKPPLPTARFRTCLPGGCIVEIKLGPDVLAAFRSGTVLHVAATADGGKQAAFTISLKGFSGAQDRAAELLK